MMPPMIIDWVIKPGGKPSEDGGVKQDTTSGVRYTCAERHVDYEQEVARPRFRWWPRPEEKREKGFPWKS